MKYRIDPELQYCPQCQDEYRAGIVQCASCEVELINGSKMLKAQEQKNKRLSERSMEISPDDRRPAYSGYFNALTAPAYLLPLAGGALVVTIGAPATFSLAVVVAVVQLVFARLIPATNAH